MFRILAVATALAVLALPAAQAAQCPPGYKLDCKPQSTPQKQKAPPPCRCVPEAPGNWSGGGKSDIKKKNVPQVQKQKSPGPND